MTESNVQLEAVETITITTNAAKRIHQLMEEKELQGHALRVFVSGGGCSGFQYGMAFEPDPRESDMRFSQENVEVVIDPVSLGYMAGASIDYVDDLMGGGFSIQNPNAVASCGCGNSFRTKGAHEHSEASPTAGGCGCH
jgi:iron-sulfur cluster assembly accessory protein